jgi:hypothetical protein
MENPGHKTKGVKLLSCHKVHKMDVKEDVEKHGIKRKMGYHNGPGKWGSSKEQKRTSKPIRTGDMLMIPRNTTLPSTSCDHN